MVITIFNTSDSQVQSCKMKGSFDQFTCLRKNPFHLQKHMFILLNLKAGSTPRLWLGFHRTHKF